MSVPCLDTALLKSVSRSFYLSIRFLPAAVRKPVSLAYLLARTSDTIADTESVAVPMRLRRLDEFEALVRGQPMPSAITAIQRDIQPPHAGERNLIAALPKVLQAFASLDMWDWKETCELLANIIRGQRTDLQTFQDASHVIALRDETALEDYIYLVAGCVGDWWTRTCFHHLRNYANRSESELTPLAGSFGKALQLVNILRDFSADLAAGRCYLPADDLARQHVTAHNLRQQPQLAQDAYTRWLARARELLEQGREYIAAVRTRRVRLACYVPWKLAVQTLDLLERSDPLRTREKLKVPRAAVRSALWKGIGVAFGGKVE
jgi:farnesyl-diphosphate farnesyltransferase